MNEIPFSELKDFLEEFNTAIHQAQRYAVFVRGIEFQQVQIETLEQFLQKIEVQKQMAIAEANNQKANFILCLELCVHAVLNELTVIVNLKNDKPDRAWRALVDAQQQIALAIRNHPFDGQGLNGYAYQLYMCEIYLFPKMFFASRGCVVANSKCSICDDSIESCNHIPGYAYMGKICYEIVQEIITIDEISLVTNPADKSCRIISFSENGKSIDVFTHREMPSDSPNTSIT